MARLSTSPLVTTYTLEQFWRLPDSPDRSKLELIAGVLYMTPPPEPGHDDIVKRLIRLLTRYLLEHNDKGSLYVPRAALWRGPNTYLEPDLFYISADLEAKLDPKHRTTADLVIEVVSPVSTIYDRNTKADTCFALGVRELWLVDEVSGTMEIRTQATDNFISAALFEQSQQIQSMVFPDLDLTVAELFQD